MTTLSLEQCVSAIIDYRGKSPRKTSSGVPLITAKVVKGGRIEAPDEFIDGAEYDEWMRRGLPQVGDVVITTEAPLGEVAQLSESRIALAQRLILLRGKPGLLDNTYLKYLLMSDEMQAQLASRASGTTVVGIKQSELRKLTLSLPAIEEQEAIAGVLGSLDDKIDQNRRVGRALEGLARATFKAWFVDFEPVKSKAADATSFPGMPPAAFAALPDRLTETPLGAVPQGWRISSIGIELKTVLGGTPSRARAEFWTDGTVPWINSGEVNKFPISDPTSLITPVALAVSSTKLIPARSTVIAITGATLGQVSILGIAACTNQSVVSIIGSKELPTEFIYLWVKENINRLLKASTGAAQQHVNKNDVNALPVLCPDARLMDGYVSIVGPVFDSVLHLSAESRKLAALRDYLLPRLLSGRVRVRRAEAEVKACCAS